MVKAACPWRLLPGDFPPWTAVEQQSKRWIKAGCFEVMVHDLRELVRLLAERNPRPSAAIYDGRTLQSSPESGARAGYDGYKRKKGSKVHVAVDTLGHLLALVVTPANEQERAQVAALSEQVQKATQRHVELAWVDSGYTGPEPAAAASAHGSCPAGHARQGAAHGGDTHRHTLFPLPARTVFVQARVGASGPPLPLQRFGLGRADLRAQARTRLGRQALAPAAAAQVAPDGGDPTRKVRTICACGVPASAAATTRSRRSKEYAFIVAQLITGIDHLP